MKAAVENLNSLWNAAYARAGEQGALQPDEEVQSLQDSLTGAVALTGEAMAMALSEISFTEFEEQSLLALYDLDNHSGVPAEIAKQAGHTDERDSKRGISDAGEKVAEYLALKVPQDSEKRDDLAPHQLLVTERWANNQSVWMLRLQVVYAIRKSWEEFVVPFDEREAEPSGAHDNKAATTLCF